jgi:hypothetical protein
MPTTWIVLHNSVDFDNPVGFFDSLNNLHKLAMYNDLFQQQLFQKKNSPDNLLGQ